MSNMRICKFCSVEKPIDLFVKDKKCKDGYRQKCKDCQNASRRKVQPKSQPEPQLIKIAVETVLAEIEKRIPVDKFVPQGIVKEINNDDDDICYITLCQSTDGVCFYEINALCDDFTHYDMLSTDKDTKITFHANNGRIKNFDGDKPLIKNVKYEITSMKYFLVDRSNIQVTEMTIKMKN